MSLIVFLVSMTFWDSSPGTVFLEGKFNRFQSLHGQEMAVHNNSSQKLIKEWLNVAQAS